MPHLMLTTSSGQRAKFPIYSPQFTADGTLYFFEAHVKGGKIYTADEAVTPLILKTTDMSAEDWTKMIATIASLATTASIFVGPVGLVVGGMLGAAAYFWQRPAVDGYYHITDKDNSICLLRGKIHRTDRTVYVP